MSENVNLHIAVRHELMKIGNDMHWGMWIVPVYYQARGVPPIQCWNYPWEQTWKRGLTVYLGLLVSCTSLLTAYSLFYPLSLPPDGPLHVSWMNEGVAGMSNWLWLVPSWEQNQTLCPYLCPSREATSSSRLTRACTTPKKSVSIYLSKLHQTLS